MLQDILEKGFLHYSLECTSFKPSSFHTSQLEVRLLRQGVIEFIPRIPTTSAFLISCGVHGNETAPIEVCDRLIEAILVEEVIPQHVLQIQVAHLPAIVAGKRYIDDNMNRHFNQTVAPQNTASYEVKRAWELQGLTKIFFERAQYDHKFHFDLHTSIRPSIHPLFAVYPLQKNQIYHASLLKFLAKSQINTVLLSEQKTSTYSMFSTELGVQALTIELGKVNAFGNNDLAILKPFWSQLLNWLTQPPEIKSTLEVPRMDYFRVYKALIKDTNDFYFNFPDSIENFTPFNEGDILAFYSGQPYKAPKDIAIVFPNPDVALGERAALLVQSISPDVLRVF